MKAIVRRAYGSTEVLELRETERPRPAEGEVLVRVHGAGVERGALHFMTGLPYPLRLAGNGLRTPKYPFLGRELAGVVVEVGSREAGAGGAEGDGGTGAELRVGDEVFGVGEGTFAEYACAKTTKLAPKPAGLTFPQAAALGVSGLTALQGLRDHGRVGPGTQVLITGASGGVGTFAVQLAAAFGAEVTAVCRTSKADLVRSLGADHVIDHTQEDLLGADSEQDGTLDSRTHGRQAGERRYDVILDLAGNPSLARLRHALTPRGTVVIGGGETSGRWLGGFDRQLRASALSPFVPQRLRTYICRENRADLLVLRDLCEAGKVMPAIDRTYPLAETATALRRLQEGKVRGKVVIALSSPDDVRP
ncbi:NAD(P)-dependent alcohol dehydrogenase [Streptomyces sp. NPDC051561]|uniref:NAD(P)-dependent alcohol dehydrogenase n=1 Tax=Streptomyces sp. NPDC051561 TaxID=3365658 RepID=UPI0037A0FA2F